MRRFTKKLKTRKICLISSSGGHLYQTYELKKWWNKYPHFWITKNDSLSKSLLKGEKKYFAYFPENRNLKTAFKNLLLAFRILKKEKPSLVFSTGAGLAPPFFLAAKLLKIKTVFIETFVFIPHRTLSGKLIAPISDYFIVQNKALLKIYKNAIYIKSTFTI